MTLKKPEVINQHYIPQCVLKFFKESDDFYNKDKKRIYHTVHRTGHSFPSTITKIMSSQYFYEHPKLRKNEIENLFGEFETIYSKNHGILLNHIVDYESKRIKFSTLKSEIAEHLSSMVMMHLRSGAMMYELKYMEKGKRYIDGVYRMMIRINNTSYIKAFSHALLTYYNMGIIKSSNKNFIISDQFMSTAALSYKGRFIDSTNRSIGQKDVLILFPISKEYYLCFFHGHAPSYIRNNMITLLNDEMVNEVNNSIMNNSYIQTAGPSMLSLVNSEKCYRQEYPKEIYFGGGSVAGGAGLRKEVFFYDSDSDICKFIHNPIQYREYADANKNENCPCGSGNKFGKCCRYKLMAFERFMKIVEIQATCRGYNPFSIEGCNFYEMNIFQFLKPENN